MSDTGHQVEVVFRVRHRIAVSPYRIAVFRIAFADIRDVVIRAGETTALTIR